MQSKKKGGVGFLITLFGSALGLLAVYALSEINKSKLANVEPVAENNPPVETPPVIETEQDKDIERPSPLLQNRGGQLLVLNKSDGTQMRGYELPADVSKINFPLFIITKPNTNILGLGESSMVLIERNNKGELVYATWNTGARVETEISYEELKKNAVAA